MSEPKLISPLLSNHIMGDPISEHHGVRCCPAMLKDSDHKYIVKIISIPASQVQLEALLLTGAYKSSEEAQQYFKELADATADEARLLQKLARLEGFHAYPSWQIEPMDDGIGYDVYLLGEYNMTLERYLRRNALTHLAAVNLGLDLCAALAICRRNGYLYVDLKPENIFITGTGEYRIADLGFISLASLKYASLPDKYRSAYTAPEITDAFSSLNTTLDIYAVGLILYQAFNDGQLPAPGETTAPPAYADYEMAEIILKACALNPEDRWQDPQEMGQALVSYMQRNAVNDTPIIPVPVPEEPVEEDIPLEDISEEEIPEAEIPEETTEEELPEIEITEAAEEEAEETEEPEITDEPEQPQPAEEEPTETETLPEEEAAPTEEIEATEEASDADVEEEPESTPDSSEEVEESEESLAIILDDMEQDTPSEPDTVTVDLEQFIIDGFEEDETAPTVDDAAALTSAELSDEVNAILAQADELIAHKAPDPVVAPEPVEIPMPEPIVIEEETDESAESNSEASEQIQLPEDEEETEDLSEEDDTDEDDSRSVPAETPKKKKKLRGLIGLLVAVLIVLLLAVGAFYYYENYYLQHIYGIQIDAAEDHMSVILDTQTDNSLLKVICTDTYGNTQYQAVENNRAEFTSLPSGTTYKITVEIDGFHKLIGSTSTTHTTATQTNIVSFTSIAGDTDGSVILNFSVQGPDNTNWYVKYSTGDGTEQTALCTGHMATITGLEVGSTYTFRLVPEAELYVVGNDTLEYTALPVITAENLAIQGFQDSALLVTWDAPEDITVGSWTVRCYNTEGFDTTLTVTEPAAAIEGLDPALGYTVDVKAEGMSVSKWVSVSANSITFKDILFDDSVAGQLTVTWDYEGTAPADGWMLMYTVDGSEKYIVQCDSNTCTISPLIPGGVYNVSFVLSEDITVFGGKQSHTAPQAETFNSYGVSASNFKFYMCWTPDDAGWRWYELMEEDLTTTFVSGEKASFMIYLNRVYKSSEDQIPTLFIIKNSEGVPVSIAEGRTRTWNSMWDENYTELDMPVTPTNPGEYTVDIYFAGALVTSIAFTVTAS